MIYELRVYQALPGQNGKVARPGLGTCFLHLEKARHPRDGFWTTLVGESSATNCLHPPVGSRWPISTHARGQHL
jgi:hypothetical protein